MEIDTQNELSLSRVRLNKNFLLAEAYSRVLGKREIRQVTAGGGSVRYEVEHCLGVALQCVESLCEPAGLIREVSVEKMIHGVLLGGRVVIDNAKMRDDLTQGAQASIYLATCGYDSREALRWLDGDYSMYHFQNMIGRELLYAIGRQAFISLKEDFPWRHFSRYSVKTKNENSGEGAVGEMSLTSDYWDARKVISLLDFFDSNELGVTATGSGCLSPVHSLLGVVMSVPVGAGP
jgi:hypothetical protein